MEDERNEFYKILDDIMREVKTMQKICPAYALSEIEVGDRDGGESIINVITSEKKIYPAIDCFNRKFEFLKECVYGTRDPAEIASRPLSDEMIEKIHTMAYHASRLIKIILKYSDRYVDLSDLLPPPELDLFNCDLNCTDMVQYLHEIPRKVKELESNYRNLTKLEANIRTRGKLRYG